MSLLHKEIYCSKSDFISSSHLKTLAILFSACPLKRSISHFHKQLNMLRLLHKQINEPQIFWHKDAQKWDLSSFFHHYQAGTISRLVILTLMMDVISFLITEHSRVNLHICKKGTTDFKTMSNTHKNTCRHACLISGRVIKRGENCSSPQSLCHGRALQQEHHCEGCRCFWDTEHH